MPLGYTNCAIYVCMRIECSLCIVMSTDLWQMFCTSALMMTLLWGNCQAAL